MSARGPIDWHVLHAELERLLAEGQAAPIRWIMQSRFLQAVAAEPEPVWAAYGFPVALQFQRSIADGFAAWDQDVVEEFQKTIDGCASRTAPPFAREEDWRTAQNAAAAALERERLRLGRLVAGVGVASTADGGSRPSAQTVFVPIVLEPHSKRGIPEFFRGARTACLLPLTVEAQLLYRRARGAELTVHGAADPATVRGFEEAIAHLSRTAGANAPSVGHYWFQVRWDPPATRLTGRSASLGFLLAAQSARDAYALALSQRVLPVELAVTGDVAGDEIRPVESIAEKVRATFYSEVRVMLVPAPQRGEALEEVRRLEERHPGRQLLVLGAGRLQELRQERAISLVRTRKTRELLRAFLRRLAVSRLFVALLVGLFAVAAGLGGAELWRNRPWPVAVRWEGDDLVFRNASSRDYHRERFPPGQAQEASAGPAGRVVAALDLDQSRPKEVVAITQRPGVEGNFLQALDGLGRPLWEIHSDDGLAGTPMASERLYWRFFATPAARDPEKSRLVAIRRSRYGSLSLLELLEGSSGRRLGTLANQGHLERAFVADVDGDGKLDLVIGGTENRAGAGILAVLEPDSMRSPKVGSTIDDPDWLIEPQALLRGARCVLLFPKDRLAPAGRPSCADILMQEGRLIVSTQAEVPARIVLFTLDIRDRLRPVALGALVNDSYRDLLANRDTGVTAAPIALEEERLARSVEWLTPEGWRPVPARGDSAR